MELTAKPSNEPGSSYYGPQTFIINKKGYRTIKHSLLSFISFDWALKRLKRWIIVKRLFYVLNHEGVLCSSFNKLGICMN